MTVATTLPAGLTIRRYEPGDHDAVWELHREGVVKINAGRFAGDAGLRR